jgi:hypothetical protein
VLRAWGLGRKLLCLGFSVRVKGLGLRVEGSRLRV